MHITMAIAEVSVVTFELKTFHNMASIKKHVRVIKNVLFYVVCGNSEKTNQT